MQFSCGISWQAAKGLTLQLSKFYAKFCMGGFCLCLKTTSSRKSVIRLLLLAVWTLKYFLNFHISWRAYMYESCILGSPMRCIICDRTSAILRTLLALSWKDLAAIILWFSCTRLVKIALNVYLGIDWEIVGYGLNVILYLLIVAFRFYLSIVSVFFIQRPNYGKELLHRKW